MNKVWRQGDIVISRISKLPKGAVEIKHDGVLAYGEATGHRHRIAEGRVRFFRSGAENLFEVMSASALLTHEGHLDHRLPRGKYRWNQQREADWMTETTRNVAD